ncbi:MAG: mannose-6-phosphate isomerase, class I [Micrococcales bacterium]|nr:mannose-6-phosphate isomerase, class I [Micrococcales bacterium]
MAFRLINPVRRYDWGSTTAIPRLLGWPSDATPVAELWIGAYPASPSAIAAHDAGAPLASDTHPRVTPPKSHAHDGGAHLLPESHLGEGLGEEGPSSSALRGLDVLVGEDPDGMLGAVVVAAHGPRLPFLAKILAAARPLSLQVHPHGEYCAARFAAESQQVGGGAGRLTDPWEKPEALYALTPFEAMSGLRAEAEAAELVRALGIHEAEELAEVLEAEGHKAGFTWLYAHDPGGATWTAQVPPVYARLAEEGRADPAHRLAAELSQRHVGDPSCLAPLLLNYVTLAPGEVLHTPVRTLHSLVSGTAIEVMGSSDTVLRAGLTNKTIEVDEVLRCADFTARPPLLLEGLGANSGPLYAPEGCPFTLQVADVTDSLLLPDPGPRLLLCLTGEIHLDCASPLTLTAFDTAFIPHADGPATLTGQARLAIVSPS